MCDTVVPVPYFQQSGCLYHHTCTVVCTIKLLIRVVWNKILYFIDNVLADTIRIAGTWLHRQGYNMARPILPNELYAQTDVMHYTMFIRPSVVE